MSLPLHGLDVNHYSPPLQIHQSTTGPCPNPLLSSIHHPQCFSPPLSQFGCLQHWAEFCRAQLFQTGRVWLENSVKGPAPLNSLSVSFTSIFPPILLCTTQEHNLRVLEQLFYIILGCKCNPYIEVYVLALASGSKICNKGIHCYNYIMKELVCVFEVFHSDLEQDLWQWDKCKIITNKKIL